MLATIGNPDLHFDIMRRRRDKTTHSILLALLLVVGSVQAQTSYLCGMMDKVIHDDCCCEDQNVDDVVLVDNEPCCDKSVNLVIETTTDQAQPTTKPVKFEADVDPPNLVAAVFEFVLQSHYSSSFFDANSTGADFTIGSATYLITQRLRI